ncbi:glycosyltransferase family 4 protein [Methanoregula sp.]|jgi:glycosyltransferase involved in cell wall biosynthesis|uniref:glycosyltransferase family 4 protein n=1 Tax=Methanoregula sp. TaxID=2052170 RepID=UPI003567CA99
MKILMLNYEYPPLGGGAAPVTKSLAEELVHLGHEVDVVTMGYKTLPREEVIHGVQIYRVQSIRKKLEMCTSHEMLSYVISAARFLPGLLNENNYDINHTHFIIPTGIVSSLYYKRIPYIITTHGSDVPGYNPDRFQFQHHLFKPFSNMVLNRASCITSPSIYLKEKILKNFGERKVAIVPNGLSVESYHPRTKENKILTVSRLFERKGIQYVIEAMAGIEGFEYTICGDGPYKPYLERQIERLNLGHKIKLCGYLEQDQLIRQYESASVFVLPSSSENFPMVLMEAMAAGCAIVTSDATGCAEVVGDTALLVRQKDSKGIQEALLTLLHDRDLQRDLAMRARVRVEREFGWSRVAGKYVHLYERVLERG